MSACVDFIDVDEENEDNEHVEQPVEPLAKPIDQPLLKQIKTEKGGWNNRQRTKFRVKDDSREK